MLELRKHERSCDKQCYCHVWFDLRDLRESMYRLNNSGSRINQVYVWLTSEISEVKLRWHTLNILYLTTLSIWIVVDLPYSYRTGPFSSSFLLKFSLRWDTFVAMSRGKKSTYCKFIRTTGMPNWNPCCSHWSSYRADNGKWTSISCSC